MYPTFFSEDHIVLWILLCIMFGIRKGNSCMKRNFSFEEEMEILHCQFLTIFYLLLDSTTKDPPKPINKLSLRFAGLPFKCTNKYFVSIDTRMKKFDATVPGSLLVPSSYQAQFCPRSGHPISNPV
jgi:hypothetical protein